MSRSLPSPAAIWRLFRLFRTERPDVLQTWLYHADFFGLLIGKAALVPAIAWNIRCSHMGEEYQRGINGILLRTLTHISHYPDAIVANSYAGKEEHVSFGYSAKRWEVLQNGFNLQIYKADAGARTELRRELGLPDETVLIGLVARYNPVKDHAGFLRAAALLLAEERDVHFMLAGGGIDQANGILNGLIDQLGIRNRIHLLGRRDDVPMLTAGLDIATCCSLGEGFPNVVGEAMACLVPCVTTDVGDAARIVGDTGLVVPAGDALALARGWRELIAKGAGGRAELGRRAMARIESDYSMTRCVERYQDFYQGLAKHPMQ